MDAHGEVKVTKTASFFEKLSIPLRRAGPNWEMGSRGIAMGYLAAIYASLTLSCEISELDRSCSEVSEQLQPLLRLG